MKRTHRILEALGVSVSVLATAMVPTGCGGGNSGAGSGGAAAGGQGGNVGGSAAGGRDTVGGSTGGGAGRGSGGTATGGAGTGSGGAGMGGQPYGGSLGSGGVVGTGGGSAAGAGGTSASDGSAGGSSGPACRTYATAYTFASSLGAVYSFKCSHSETASGFDRICQQSSTTDTEHWASKSDFIDEAAAVGITKVLSSTRSYPAFRTDFNYDAQGRLDTIVTGATPYITYDQWDDLKRPLHGVMGVSCDDAESTLSYTDRTTTVNTATGVCAQQLVVTFDADGIQTFVDYGNGTTATYTTTGRATVCR